jgi:periplasmic protein TonB
MKRYILFVFLKTIIIHNGLAQNAQNPPSFVGGEMALKTFIKQNLRFPTQDNVQGTVFVGFTIEADGSVTDIKIKKALRPDLDAEAIRILQIMPKWIAAKDPNGKAVPCMMTYPMKFKIE